MGYDKLYNRHKIIDNYNNASIFNKNNPNLKAEDLYLFPCIAQFKKGKENMNTLENEQGGKIRDYLSTHKFFKYLTELSRNLFKSGCKWDALQKELIELNKHLPAAVYIPITHEYIRNYAILKIVVDEFKAFPTKERCPIYLCFEIYCPDEIK